VHAGLYCLVAWYFSQKMIRLVLLLAPAGAATGGIGLAWILAWCYRKLTEEGMTDEERRAKVLARRPPAPPRPPTPVTTLTRRSRDNRRCSPRAAVGPPGR
jgi:hypothetical protein